jgi:hypothetical protein
MRTEPFNTLATLGELRRQIRQGTLQLLNAARAYRLQLG